MPDYRLEGLSTRSFEQLIQALAQKHLGARTIIFGDGADGAREAEFRGKAILPPKNEEWDGHVILQAKFLQTLKSSPKENTDWLIGQIERELKKFAPRTSKSKKRVRAPDYYVIATNVRNSGVAKKGGKDRLAVILNLYKEKLGWKSWVLWDAAEISRMLDDAAHIRTAYAAWITTGDVLMEMMAKIKTSSPDFQKRMLVRLQEDFCGAQYAKLRQAGHGSEDKTPLSRLFVDLPITHKQVLEPPTERDKADERSGEPALKLQTFLESLLEKGDMRLSPTAIGNVKTWGFEHLDKSKLVLIEGDLENISGNIEVVGVKSELIRRWKKQPKMTGEFLYSDFWETNDSGNRVVLLGGPGQGKTTLGQFACQLYRAALLEDYDKPLLQETRDALQTLRTQCGSEVARPRARRYPVWIDLKELAKWLAGKPDDPPPSLLTFLAGRLGPTVRLSDIEAWLALYPWLVVFDGLDEVPPSSGRDRMLKCVQTFVTEANTLDSDLLVLCTTRPQGYSREFDERYYKHLWLAPLSPSRGLAYGEKVLDSRHGKSGDDRRVFGERLRQAATNETTARVMRSPLQVTIMTALVERVGKPPEQRWKLFREYYGVIYERERERGTAWSNVLAKYDAEVDAIHRRVAWRLQVRSETAKNSDARLSSAEFQSEVRTELEHEGHADQGLNDLVSLLGNAATERLVFLVALGSEEVGFEIRSLQEFMAADHLFKFGDETAARHLGRIAPIAYWRNVFLFAAGRVFAERRNLREHLLGILAHLNEDASQPTAKLSLAGSILALDILEDGSANHIPASRDALMRIACRILDIALPAEHRRLAEIGMRCNEQILSEELRRRLTGGDREAWFGAFNCIVPLWDRLPWARELGETFWPRSRDDMRRLAVQHHRWNGRLPFLRLLGPLLRESSPYSRPAIFLDPTSSELVGIPAGLAIFSNPHFFRPSNLIPFEDSSSGKLPIGLVFNQIFFDKPVKQWSFDAGQPAELHPEWQVLWINAVFAAGPGAESLAEALERLPNAHSWPLTEETIGALAWPLAIAVSCCASWEDVPSLTARIRKGDFGDTNQWKRFEEALLQDELRLSDFSTLYDKPKNEVQRAGAACGFNNEILLKYFSTRPIFASPYNDEGDNEETTVGLDTFLSELAQRNSRWAIRIIEELAHFDAPAGFAVSTFISIACLAENQCLPVSQAWLEDQLLRIEIGSTAVGEFDELGLLVSDVRQSHHHLGAEQSTRAVMELIKAIAKRPGNVGLWRLLSLIPPHSDPTAYSHLINFLPSPTNPQERADAVALRMSGIMWTTASAEELALEILQVLPLRPDLLRRLAQISDHIPVGDSTFETLPALLLEQMPRDDWENRSILRAALRRLHLRKPSGLGEEDDERAKVLSL